MNWGLFMDAVLADIVQRLNLQPGQAFREVVNGHTAELRLLDDMATPELAEQVMLQAWFETPFDSIATVAGTPGQIPLPDPPVIPPDDQPES